MTLSQICLDYDSVLVNWTGAVAKCFGIDPKEFHSKFTLGKTPEGILGVSEEEMWARLETFGEKFWVDIEPYPWALDLYHFCTGIAPTIVLTKPCKHPFSCSGKVISLKNLFGASFSNFLIGPRKEFCAHPTSLLVDDMERNCSKFEARGGLSVLFPQPWNRLRDVALQSPESGFKYAQEEITRIAEFTRKSEGLA